MGRVGLGLSHASGPLHGGAQWRMAPRNISPEPAAASVRISSSTAEIGRPQQAAQVLTLDDNGQSSLQFAMQQPPPQQQQSARASAASATAAAQRPSAASSVRLVEPLVYAPPTDDGSYPAGARQPRPSRRKDSGRPELIKVEELTQMLQAWQQQRTSQREEDSPTMQQQQQEGHEFERHPQHQDEHSHQEGNQLLPNRQSLPGYSASAMLAAVDEEEGEAGQVFSGAGPSRTAQQLSTAGVAEEGMASVLQQEGLMER